jgi:hypothetical protein
VSNAVIWVYWACNVSTDLYLLSIPLPLLWVSQLQKWKKISLICLFSGGLFIVVCATLRCVLIVTNSVDGAQLAGSWAVRETFVAVVTTNLPLVFTLVKGWLGPLVTRVSTGRSSQKDTNGTPRITPTYGGGRSWRPRGPPTANPITDFTMNGSEEHIIYEMKRMDEKPPVEGVQKKTEETERNIHKSVQVAVVREERQQPPFSEKDRGGKRVSNHPWEQVQPGHSAFVQGRKMSLNRGSFRH